MRITAQAVAATLLLAGASTAHAAAPTIVSAYVNQLVQSCGPAPANATVNLTDEVDLTGDKILDWVVDASRYPCPGRPAVAMAAGSQVTIFKGEPDGRARPVFQRTGFGARLARTPQEGYALWVTMAGSDCEEVNPQARCERRVQWNSKAESFELAPLQQPSTRVSVKSGERP